MTIDMRSMLGRVVPDVFHEHLVTVDVNSDHKMWPCNSLVNSHMNEGRSQHPRVLTRPAHKTMAP